MEMKKAAQKLCEAAEKIGVIAVLTLCGGSPKLHIPMTNRQWDASIDDMNLSIRAFNGLCRAGLDTVGAVAERIMTEQGLSTVRNLGRKSICEIKTALVAYGYEGLNSLERLSFWNDFVSTNY